MDGMGIELGSGDDTDMSRVSPLALESQMVDSAAGI
jgi:hypothetical protein